MLNENPLNLAAIARESTLLSSLRADAQTRPYGATMQPLVY